MTVTAKNVGRINVWPSYEDALDADTDESKVLRRMTIWGTYSEARAHISEEEGGGGDGDALLLEGGGYLLLEGGGRLLLEGL